MWNKNEMFWIRKWLISSVFQVKALKYIEKIALLPFPFIQCTIIFLWHHIKDPKQSS